MQGFLSCEGGVDGKKMSECLPRHHVTLNFIMQLTKHTQYCNEKSFKKAVIYFRKSKQNHKKKEGKNMKTCMRQIPIENVTFFIKELGSKYQVLLKWNVNTTVCCNKV